MKVNGVKIAREILKDVRQDIKKLRLKTKLHLAVVLVGRDPATISYVTQKQKAARRVGAKISVHTFSKTPAYQKIAQFLLNLSRDREVHGIILQRPLPPSLSAADLTKRISVAKDVDGFLPKTPFTPPIGLAIIKILNVIYFKYIIKRTKPKDDFSKPFTNWLKQKQTVLVGRGETGGRPIAETFNQHHLNVIILNSQSENIVEYLQNADIVISAVGKSNVVKSIFLKTGTILLGVGLHREKKRLIGDYIEHEVEKVASFYTPTPGGTGPVNVACLMQNLVQAYTQQMTFKHKYTK